MMHTHRLAGLGFLYVRWTRPSGANDKVQALTLRSLFFHIAADEYVVW
jgi:hypothetical protein